jgi:MarR family transcriptional regulator, organic hydroperoxide resistance regulator
MTSEAPVAVQDDPLALDRQVCFALAVASRSVIGLYRPVLEPLGLTHPQYLVMLALWQHESLSVKDLGRLLQLDSGTLSPLLKRLAGTGLVTRQRQLRDERSVVVGLTEQGRALRQRAERVPHEVVRRLGMDVEELLALHNALTRVIAAASAS